MDNSLENAITIYVKSNYKETTKSRKYTKGSIKNPFTSIQEAMDWISTIKAKDTYIAEQMV